MKFFLPHFRDALLTFGRTHPERAEALGMPLRTFMERRAGYFPRSWLWLLNPVLLRALADDLEKKGSDVQESA